MTFGVQDGGGVVMFRQGKQSQVVRSAIKGIDYESIKLFTYRIFC